MSASEGDARERLFVALDLPDAARHELAAWRERSLPAGDDLRPVRPESLHLTLVFLGWRDRGDAEAIPAAVRGAVAELAAPQLGTGELRAVPPRRARLVALDLVDRDGRCAALQAAVAEALERGGLYEPELRPFWPHVTLARVRRGRRAPALGPERPGLGPFTADRVTLYRSLLKRDGAVYEPIERWRLRS